MNHSGQMIGRIARRYASNVAIITNSTYIGLHPCQRMRFDVQDHHHRTLSSSIVNLRLAAIYTIRSVSALLLYVYFHNLWLANTSGLKACLRFVSQ